MSINIPPAETVKVSDIKTDGQNPNKMSKESSNGLRLLSKNGALLFP
jgi:hypothetical protein